MDHRILHKKKEVSMSLYLVKLAVKALCATGLTEKALRFLVNKLTAILLDEQSGRAAFSKALAQATDEELMDYVPDVYQEDIYQIDYSLLKAHGIELISFDIDDTIDDSFINKLEANAPLLTVTMPEKAKDLVRDLRGMGFKVVLLTNAQTELAEGACADLQADGYIARAKKPAAGGFETIAATYQVDRSQMAHVGNSIRADIAGGNRFGITTCLVRRAGTSMKLMKLAAKLLGRPTKGHLIRERLLERDLWRKHHLHNPGDQYYQLGAEPAYRKADAQELPAVTVFYDGDSPYSAAFKLCRYIQSIGYRAALKDAGEYHDGYPGKAILVGHHGLAKKQLEAVGVLYNSYGMMFGYAQDVCVLRASKSALGKGKKGRAQFETYYNTRILAHRELADSYTVPLRFDSKDRSRRPQYSLLWLEFAHLGLPQFLGGPAALPSGPEAAPPRQTAESRTPEADGDTVYTLDELLRNIYKTRERAGMETLRRHLGADIVFTGLWAGARDERELEESELLEGELSGYVFTIGGYTLRSASCLYLDDDSIDYSERVPAGPEALARYRQEGWRMLGAEDGVREVQALSARYGGRGDWHTVCLVTSSLHWDESIHFIGTLKPTAASQESLFILKQYTGDSYGIAYWYALAPDGTISEYGEHPYDPGSFERPWNDLA